MTKGGRGLAPHRSGSERDEGAGQAAEQVGLRTAGGEGELSAFLFGPVPRFDAVHGWRIDQVARDSAGGNDLSAAGFGRVEAQATGRPGYAPGDLLKLYIYGHLNRMRSSRRLEAECHRNIEVIWLLRTLKPDFKTIADFRRDNRGAFKSVFRQFVLLCRRLDLFGRELLAVDGTRIKAVNNKDRNFTRHSLEIFIRVADGRLDA